MIIKKYWFAIMSALGLGLILYPALAWADVSVKLDPIATTTPNSAVVITGTITNSDSVNYTSLTESGLTASSTDIGLDANGTSNYLPQVLAPGQQYQGPILKILVGGNAQTQNAQASYNIISSSAITATNTVTTLNMVIPIIASTTTVITTPVPATTTTTTIATTTDFSNFVGLQMPQYQNGPRLIKLEGDSTVYWVSGANAKIPMFSAKAFLSYGNKWSDIQSVGQQEFDAYPTAQFIRLNGGGSIYYVGDGTPNSGDTGIRRMVPSEIWNSTGLDVSKLIDVNKTDFNTYKVGDNISALSDLGQAN